MEHYRNGDYGRAALYLDRLREVDAWEAFPRDELYGRILDRGVMAYEELGDAERAARLVGEVLPHLPEADQRVWQEQAGR